VFTEQVFLCIALSYTTTFPSILSDTVIILPWIHTHVPALRSLVQAASYTVVICASTLLPYAGMSTEYVHVRFKQLVCDAHGYVCDSVHFYEDGDLQGCIAVSNPVSPVSTLL
jgi:hypothetical protein